MNEIQKYIAANEPKIMEELFSLIRIPSISALPEHKDDMLACALRWKELLLTAYRVGWIQYIKHIFIWIQLC